MSAIKTKLKQCKPFLNIKSCYKNKPFLIRVFNQGNKKCLKSKQEYKSIQCEA